MSNYDRNVPGPDLPGTGLPGDNLPGANLSGSNYSGRVPPGRTRSAGSWITGAVVVVLLLIAIGYVFNYRPGSGLVEQRAAAPDNSQTTAPMSPVGTPLPDNTPAAKP